MDTAFIDTLTKMRQPQRSLLLNWLADQGEAVQLEAFKLQGDLAQQHRSNYTPDHRAEYYFSMMILALDKMHWVETSQSQKARLSDEQTKKLTEFRIERIKARRKTKASPKKDQIRIRYFEEIRQLRDKGLSWRQIADYIALYHKQRFTFGYLRECFQDLADSRKDGKDGQS